MSRAGRLAGALAAGLVLIVLVAGLPVALWSLTSWLASGATGDVTDLTGLQRLLSSPDDGTLVLLVLVAAGWVGWATFAVALSAEVVARARGGSAPAIPGLGMQQRVVAALVAAVLLAGAPLSAQAVTTAPAAAHRGAGAGVSRPVESMPPAPNELPLLAAAGQTRAALTDGGRSVAAAPVVVAVEVPVAEGDTLWRLAETHLGGGMRWRELAAENYGRAQPDGLSLDAGHVLQPGWRLVLPAVADAPDTTGNPSGAGGMRTVVPGDTLSGIAADELGDADRYPELAAATAELVQPDGRRLTDPDLIHPGWTVAIPTVSTDSATTVPSSPPQATADPTAPGTPDAAATPDAATPDTAATPDAGATQASPAISQTVGASPVPTTSAEPVTAAPVPTTAAVVADPTATRSAALPPAESSSQPTAAPAPGGDVLDSEDLAGPVRTATGIGALLAAAFLAMLALRRSRQRAHRRPGHRIALPTRPHTQEVEAQLREVAVAARPDALAAVLADLAMACRVAGAGLPPLRAARLEPEAVELYLAAPATLPAPWTPIGGDPATGAADGGPEAGDQTSDRTIWTRPLPPAPVTAGDRPDPLTGAAVPAQPPAPYPTLVTIGHDTPTSLLLLNLDELGVFAVSGPGAVEMQTAIAAELAGSPWSADVLVTVLDADPALCAALPGGRIRSISADRLLVDLRARTAATAEALQQAGAARVADARHAETGDDRGQGEGDWEFEVVLALAPLTEQTERELVAMARTGYGVSVVLFRGGTDAEPQRAPVEDAMWLEHRAADDSGEPTAMLHPVAVPLVPQRLGVDALHALLDAVAHTARPSAAAAPTVVTLPVVSPDAEPSIVMAPAVVALPPGTPTVVALPPGTPAVATPTVTPPAVVALPTVVALPAVESPESPSAPPAAVPASTPPRLRLLGHVGVEGATGPEPGTHTARTVALIAVLATHRQGRTREELAQALSPNNRLADGTLHALVSRARRWLGTAADGRSYLPRIPVSGSAVYRLDPEVATDWDAWRSLVGPEPSRARLDDLLEALDLVRDAPLAGVVERHYTWAEAIREEMIASIVDVAHAVATRSLATGDLAQARRGIQAGRRADPTSEMLWRDALRVESAAGAHGAVASLVGHIQQWSDDAGLDLDPATEALMLQLGPERARSSAPQAVGRP